MTEKDVKELLITIVCCFPSFKPDDMTRTIKTWHKQLADVRSEDAEDLLNRYIHDNKGGYPPAVSNLIPKPNDAYGFRGRTYTHEFYEQIEREVERGMYD